MPTASASEVFAPFGGRKNTTSASCRGSRLSWALAGAGYSNQLQLAQVQGPVRDCALVQAAMDETTLQVQVESMCQRLREKHHYRKLLPVMSTASTKCKGQGARCKGQG